jgi:hypothetical protein
MKRTAWIGFLGTLALHSAAAWARQDDVQVTESILKLSTTEREPFAQCTALFRLASEAGGKKSTVTVLRPGGGIQTAVRIVFGTDLSGLTAQFADEGQCEATFNRQDARGVNAVFARDGALRVFLGGETARTLVLIARKIQAASEDAPLFPGSSAVRRTYLFGAFTASEILSQAATPPTGAPSNPQGELYLE